MAYALVGSLAFSGPTQSPLTPAWGAGANRTAGNLLVCWCSANTGNPLSVSGFTRAVRTSGTGGQQVEIWTKIATGGDAAPVVSEATLPFEYAVLGEFSGNDWPNAPDVVGTFTATPPTSPQDAVASGPDADVGELVLAAGYSRYSANSVVTDTIALNNGATFAGLNNNANSDRQHVVFGYGITTGNSVANDVTFTFTTALVTSAGAAVASYKLAGATPLVDPDDVYVRDFTEHTFGPF